jgi:hypothetical protein
MICIIDTNHILLVDHSADSPQNDFKERYKVMLLGVYKVQQSNDTQHDLLEMACFLHESRARIVITYYKSRSYARWGFAEGAYILFEAS